MEFSLLFHALLILQRRLVISLAVKFSYYLGLGLIWFGLFILID
jgi:hypothetical protein